MRVAISASLLAAGVLTGAFSALSVSPVSAQSTTTGYPYCLMTGPDQECAYTSIAQCMAARRGNVDFCEPNNLYVGNTQRSSRSRMQ